MTTGEGNVTMAKRLEYDIVTDPSKGIAGLKQFSGAAKKALKDVNESMDDTTTSAQKVAKALSGLAGEIETEMKGAAKAADALSTALGPELAQRADVDQIVQDLKKMGLTFDEITADADALAGSLKQLDDVQMSGPAKGLRDIEDSTKKARAGVEDVGRSAESSKSVLANMVGNTTQDLGALGGVAGTTGVAIGQIGEYAADAIAGGERLGTVLASFTTAALPIAAISVGIGLITKAVSDYQQRQEQVRARIKATSDALLEQLGITDQLADSYNDSATAIGQLIDTMDEEQIRKTAGALGILNSSFGDLDDTIVGLAANADTTIANLLRGGGLPEQFIDPISKIIAKEESWKDIDFRIAQQFDKSTEKRIEGYKDLIKAAEQVQDTQEDLLNEDVAKQFLAVAGTVDQATAKIVAHAIATNKSADGQVDWVKAMLAAIPPINAHTAAVEKNEEKIKEWQQGIEDTTKALEEWATQAEQDIQTVAAATADAQRAFDDLAEPFARMSRAGEAMEEAFALGNVGIDSLNQITDINDAIRDLGKFISEEGVPNIFDPNDVNAGPFLDKIASVRDPIQREIGELFAAGDAEGAKALADAYVDQVFKALKGKLSKDQIRTLFNLGEFEAKVKVAVDRDSLKTAEAMIELIAGFPGADPLWVAQVRLDLDAGKITPDVVKVLVADKAKGAGLNVPTELLPPTSQSMTAARQSADDFYRRNPAAMGTKTTAPTNLATTLRDTQRLLNLNPLTVAVRAIFPSGFLHDAGGTAGPGGGIVAERRPEIVNGRWLVTEPTVVPAGTRVTSGARTARVLRTRGTAGLRRYDQGGTVTGSTRHVTINVNAGVVGNRYDVMRAVTKAEHDAERLLGTRG